MFSALPASLFILPVALLVAVFLAISTFKLIRPFKDLVATADRPVVANGVGHVLPASAVA
jgi:hypothetical protein